MENGSVATSNMLVVDKPGKERVVGVMQGEDPKRALGTALRKPNAKKSREERTGSEVNAKRRGGYVKRGLEPRFS